MDKERKRLKAAARKAGTAAVEDVPRASCASGRVWPLCCPVLLVGQVRLELRSDR